MTYTRKMAEFIRNRGGPVSATLSTETVFKVYEEHDKNEGRGGRDVRYVVADEADARLLSRGLGVMGTDGSVEREDHVVLLLDGRRYSIAIHEMTDERARGALLASALRKLTDDERRALLGK